jgi:leucyl aminopeptidase (aminopeptidase T)
MIVIRKPIICSVKGGFVTDISGGAEAVRLLGCIRTAERRTARMATRKHLTAVQAKRFAKNVRNLGEFGIGMNRNARIVGNILEDEKAYGTCHFAIGANFDGDAPALIHLDGLVKKPTIHVMYRDGSDTVVMKDGRLLRRKGPKP